MAELPLTRNRTSPEREAAIRDAVRQADRVPSSGASSRLATIEDARDLFELLDHPGVRDWIYSLPRPLTLEGVRAYIETCVSRRERGEVLLSLNFDEEGRVSGFSEVHIWPEWAAGEVAGAMRPDLQNRGQGGSGMAAMFTWMFETFDLDLISNTTALDNVRIQSLFRKTGCEYKGDIESRRPDGTIRASQVWEVTRETWFERLGRKT